MNYRSVSLCASMILLTASGPLTADGSNDRKYNNPSSDKPSQQSPEAIAKQLWSIMDQITAQHIDLPTGQEMMLGAARGLVHAASDALPPYHLSERISSLMTFDQFQSLVTELWPRVPEKGWPAKAERAMVDGLLTTVPANTMLMSPTALRVQNQVAVSHYVGIGVQYDLNEAEQLQEIVTPFRGGPAHRAGIKPGDLLLEVDGHSTKGVDFEVTANWVRGPEGTPVTIVVRRPNSTEKRTYHIIRGVIPIETVQGYRLAGNDGWHYQIDPAWPIGYIYINAINSSTLHELRQAEATLKAQGVHAVVIDFRFTGAGNAPHQAEIVGDSLVGGGLMWRVHDVHDQVKDCKSSRECLFRGWPMAVLLNEEITDPMVQALAAALEDNKRAVLIGQSPKSDEFIKTQLDLPDGLGGIMVRSARLERPDAKRGWPVKPDHIVSATAKERAAIGQWLADKQLTELPKGTTDAPPVDPQLEKAVSVLKDSLRLAASAGK